MKQKWLARALSLVMVAAFVPSIAMAQDYDLKDGNIEVKADASGQYVSQGERQNELQTSETRITGTSDTSTITIDAGAGATANVTLENVNIDVSNTGSSSPANAGNAAITVTGEGDVNLNIKGDNSVSSGYGRGGVEKASSGNLTIGSASGEGSTEGKLVANGGKNGAGIGGSGGYNPDKTKNVDKANASNITITGSTITANGGAYAAGIGGGKDAQGKGGSGSNIKITGGDITANGYSCGAGIGGGIHGDGTDIEITGGKVTANGSSSGAGIGGGASGGKGNHISISGDATVTAKGGGNGAGSNISISGDTVVKADSGDRGAGIGGGADGNGSVITISGNAKVEAKGGFVASAIGGGSSGTGTGISISENVNVKVSSGWNADTLGEGAAIGDGGSNGGKTGTEVDPNTFNLGPNGKIEYYGHGADFEKDKPWKTFPEEKKPSVDPEKPENSGAIGTAEGTTDGTGSAAALYQVTDLEGKPISYKAQRKDGVLTLTVTADDAILTGTLGGLETLAAEGVKEITLTNGTDSASITLADLIAKGASADTYALTLQNTLTLNGESVDL